MSKSLQLYYTKIKKVYSSDFNILYKDVVDSMIIKISNIFMYHIKISSIFDEYIKAEDKKAFLSDKDIAHNEDYDGLLTGTLEVLDELSTGSENNKIQKYNFVTLSIQQALETLVPETENSLIEVMGDAAYIFNEVEIDDLNFDINLVSHNFNEKEYFNIDLSTFDRFLSFVQTDDYEFVFKVNDESISSKEKDKFMDLFNKYVPEMYKEHGDINVLLYATDDIISDEEE